MYNRVMDNSFILVIIGIRRKKKDRLDHKHRIPLKVCSRINRIIMGLTTWMKKCVVSVQI